MAVGCRSYCCVQRRFCFRFSGNAFAAEAYRTSEQRHVETMPRPINPFRVGDLKCTAYDICRPIPCGFLLLHAPRHYKNREIRPQQALPREARQAVGMETKPIWLDCDPGHDDALAIILAAYHPKAELLGVSTVFGNQSLEKVTKNAHFVLHAAGIDSIGVYAGQRHPLMRPSFFAEEIHGKSGLDGFDAENGALILDAANFTIPQNPKKMSTKKKALFAMHDAINTRIQRQPNQPVYVVCTAALTNMALFLSVYPELIPKIRVVCMGGTTGMGNYGRVTEFNFMSDPEATRMVFESGVHLTMIPLDVTHTALATKDICHRLCGDSPSKFRTFVQQTVNFFAKTYKETYNFDAPPIHDPCAVLCALHPEFFELSHIRVDIETSSTLTSGQSVCDMYGHSKMPPNCYVGRKMDVVKFWQAMVAAVKEADCHSPLNSPAKPHL